MEPCGGLPVVSFYVHAHFCVYHQAWSASVQLVRQDDEDPVALATRSCSFGPFDRRQDVTAWIAATTDELEQEAAAALGWW